MVSDKNKNEKIEEAEIRIMDIDYTNICFHCKCQPKTSKEMDQDYCESDWEKYCDEYDAICGDDGQTKYKQNKKS